MSPNQIVVRVSRWLLLMLIGVGLLLLAAGLDMAFLHRVFEPVGVGENPVLMGVFAVFMILLGAVIVVSQVFYLAVPPVMLRVNGEGLWFGAGLRYKPTFIPLKHLKSVGVYKTESMVEVAGKRKIVDGGVELELEPCDAVPASMVTSAGISYSDYRLRLFKAYMSRSLPKTVEGIKDFM